MKTILVTGGLGYIGSHTGAALINAGYDIIIIDNLSNANPDVLRRLKTITDRDIPFYAADITHYDSIKTVFERHSVDAVIHFAGLKAVSESVEKPLLYYTNNITGTLNLCRVMNEHGVKRIVFSSSATVYAGADPPYTEDSPLNTINPYGATKLFIENILQDIVTSDNEWRVCLLRYFNPVGAHESGLLGDDPNGIPNNLMPLIVRAAKGVIPRLSVFGGDYDTPDGTCVRDYIHVCDLAQGHIKALDFLNDNKGAHAFNLGTGAGVSVIEIIKAFEKAAGRTVPYTITGRRQGDSPVSYANAAKAREYLKWEAKLSIEEMCESAWRFSEG